ncbi:MAG: DUF4333 domain-containing protein [Mycobacterium sp.]|nr:DUF4333 domain-containing protein [Mycobacterium sp.]
MRKSLVIVTGSLLALGASAGIAAASMSGAEVQEMISSQLAAQTGTPPAAVDCPGELETDIGSSITCALTIGDETRGVTVTVVSFDNGQLNFSMKLARQ